MLNLPAIKRPYCEVMSPYINYPKAGKETMLLKKQQGLQISIVLQIASNSDFFFVLYAYALHRTLGQQYV